VTLTFDLCPISYRRDVSVTVNGWIDKRSCSRLGHEEHLLGGRSVQDDRRQTAAHLSSRVETDRRRRPQLAARHRRQSTAPVSRRRELCISIGSAVFAGLTVVINTQTPHTHRETCVGTGRIYAVHAIRSKSATAI